MHDGGGFSSGSFDHGSSHSSFSHSSPSHTPTPSHTPSPTHHPTPSHQPPHHPTPEHKQDDSFIDQQLAQQALMAQLQQDRVEQARKDHEKAMADSFLFGKPDPDRIKNRKPKNKNQWWKRYFTKEWWINR